MKRILSLVLVVLLVLSCLAGCGQSAVPEANSSEPVSLPAPTEQGSLKWPKFGVCSLLPVPPSNDGLINYDSADDADIDVYGVSQTEFEQYVADCQEMGFVIDYYLDEDDYEAYNEDNYSLWLDYDQDTEIMNIWIYLDEDYGAEESEEATEIVTEEETEATTEEPTKETEKVEDMRSDFKKAMDEYEAFMDEYIAFMEKYNENPSDLSLLADYAKFMSDYLEFVEEFEKWDNEEMNDAELAYYLEVQTRVNKKLLEIA